MNWALYALAGWTGLGALFVIARVGQARKPTTPGEAAWVVLLNAGWIVLLVLAAMRLS